MRPRTRTTRGLLRPIWWAVALILATVAVWQRYTVVRLGDEIEDLQQEIVQLERARDQLLAETALLSSRARIEAIAVGRLGLIPTSRSQLRQFLLPTPSASQGGTF